MGAITDHRALLIEVGLVGEHAQYEINEGTEADPPSHHEPDSSLLDLCLVHCQEREQDEHEACCHDSVDAEGFSVTVLVRTDIVYCHCFS